MASRFEYAFVRVDVGGGLFGGFSKEYQEVIGQYALEGWRFVQAYAPGTTGHGRATQCDLIFERELG